MKVSAVYPEGEAGIITLDMSFEQYSDIRYAMAVGVDKLESDARFMTRLRPVADRTVTAQKAAADARATMEELERASLEYAKGVLPHHREPQ